MIEFVEDTRSNRKRIARTLVPIAVAWLISMLIACPLVRADDPPKLVVPVAAVTGPTAVMTPGNQAFLDASGSVTDFPVVWTVKPASTLIPMDLDGRKRIYALIPNLAPNTDYFVTVTALGKDATGNPSGATETVTFTTKIPAPLPVANPPVPVVPPIAVDDSLGMTAFTRALVKPLTWPADTLKIRQTTIASVFLGQATQAASFADINAMITDTGNRLHTAVGINYPTWKSLIFASLEVQLKTKATTTAQLAEAFREVAAALQEGQ